MTTPAIRRLNDWHLGVPQCYLPGEPQSRELACQQKRWLQDYLNWTVLLYAAPIGKTQFISVKFSLFPFCFSRCTSKKVFFFCSCRPLYLRWPKEHKHVCTCMAAFNVCSIIASRYKLYNYSLTFYTFEQHWQIKAASLPSTNIWGSSSVVHSTAHWWLWSSHFLCVDPACHSLKCCSCCLWSLKGTYGDHTIQIFQMRWVTQKGRWIHGPRVFC